MIGASEPEAEAAYRLEAHALARSDRIHLSPTRAKRQRAAPPRSAQFVDEQHFRRRPKPVTSRRFQGAARERVPGGWASYADEEDGVRYFAPANVMSPEPSENDRELRRLLSEVAALKRDRDDREHLQETLLARLREEAAVRDGDLVELHERLHAAEHELGDLRAIRDALTPPELPQRPGLDLAAVFLPAAAERVSGDFYLVAEGPQDSTVMVVGDVVGHGLQAARRAAFVRTTFAATAPFSDDPCRLLSWANTALIERAGTSTDFVTAACVTYLPSEQRLRWAYAGHPPAVWLDDGRELTATRQGTLLGTAADPGCVEGSQRTTPGTGVLLYTDGLTEARHGAKQFGLDAVSAALASLERPSPADAIADLRARVAGFASGSLTDDLCMLAARID